MSTTSTPRISLTRYLMEQQRQNQRIPAQLRLLLEVVARACKQISHAVNKGALGDVLGSANSENVQGEVQKKLDIIANEVLIEANEWGGHLAAMASEEMDNIYAVPNRYPQGEYLLMFDPLDGSSNIDVNVSIGTIFGVYHCVDYEQRGRVEDALQPARDLVAAGYVLYGASTMLVYSTGNGVHGFTLNPEYGEFLLSHPFMRLPEPPAYYSVNASYYSRWSPGVQRFLDWLEGKSADSPSVSARYIGSLVADFHRNLLRGGIFCYPAEGQRKDGKLRLLYEAGPLAFLIEQAGGYASDGRLPILDIVPTHPHQRVALFVGNRALVERLEAFIRQEEGAIAS